MDMNYIGRKLVEAGSELGCSTLFGAAISGAMGMSPKVGVAIAATAYTVGLIAHGALQNLPTLEEALESIETFYNFIGTGVALSSVVYSISNLAQKILSTYVTKNPPSLKITAMIGVISFVLGNFIGDNFAKSACKKLGLKKSYHSF